MRSRRSLAVESGWFTAAYGWSVADAGWYYEGWAAPVRSTLMLAIPLYGCAPFPALRLTAFGRTPRCVTRALASARRVVSGVGSGRPSSPGASLEARLGRENGGACVTFDSAPS